MDVAYYVEHGWGSYKELIELSMKDFLEIKIAIVSKQQEEMLISVCSVIYGVSSVLSHSFHP